MTMLNPKPRKNIRREMLTRRGYASNLLSRIDQDDIIRFSTLHSFSYHCKIQTIATYASIRVRDGVYSSGAQRSITSIIHYFNRMEIIDPVDAMMCKTITALGIPLSYRDGEFLGEDTDWMVAIIDFGIDPILRGLNLNKLRTDISEINEYALIDEYSPEDDHVD